MNLAILENAIVQGEYEVNVDAPIVMTDSYNTQSINYGAHKEREMLSWKII